MIRTIRTIETIVSGTGNQITWVRWFRADGNSIRLCTWRCIGSVLTEKEAE
jgi:hypothetical protein